MPQVAFHFNVTDRIEYVCRLIRKIQSRRLPVVVLAESEDVVEIDQRLWTLTPLSFLPHSTPGSPPWVNNRSPVKLCTEERPPQSAGQVLVNVRRELVDHFEHLIEIVTLDEPARVAARHRWKAYVMQGFKPERHDVSARAVESMN